MAAASYFLICIPAFELMGVTAMGLAGEQTPSEVGHSLM